MPGLERSDASVSGRPTAFSSVNSNARATYLPIMSHSRLTRSPDAERRQRRVRPRKRDDHHVERAVAEACHGETDSIDGNRSFANEIRRQGLDRTRSSASANRRPVRISSTTPVPSTCPCTKWPPKRLSARIDRSRLTRCSCRSEPSVVTRAVSGPMSACTSPSSARDHRQADAVDGQTVAGANSGGERRPDAQAESTPVRLDAPRPSPTASMRPVNITFDERYRARAASTFGSISEDDANSAAVEQRHALPGPEPIGRHVQLDVVDDAFVPGRARAPRRRLRAEGSEYPSADKLREARAASRAPRTRARGARTRSSAARSAGLSRSASGVVSIITGPAERVENSAGVRRGAQATVEHDPRQGTLAVHLPRRQQRVVGENGPRSDGDRVHLGAEVLHAPIGGRRRELGARARRRGDAAVDARRRLEDDERAVPSRTWSGTADSAAAPRRARRRPPPSMPWARSAAKPRPLTSGNGSSIAATTRLMPAAMIRSVHGPGRARCASTARACNTASRRAARSPASFERVHFGVRLAGALVRAVADDDAFVGDDAGADERIRRRAAEPAARVLERPPHPPHVRLRHALRRIVVYHFS